MFAGVLVSYYTLIGPLVGTRPAFYCSVYEHQSIFVALIERYHKLINAEIPLHFGIIFKAKKSMGCIDVLVKPNYTGQMF